MEDVAFRDVDDLSYAGEAAEGRAVKYLIPITLKLGALISAVGTVVPTVAAGQDRAG